MALAIPATAFIDANGMIRFRILGQMRPGELQRRIDWLLRESGKGAGDGTEAAAPPAVATHLKGK